MRVCIDVVVWYRWVFCVREKRCLRKVWSLKNKWKQRKPSGLLSCQKSFHQDLIRLLHPRDDLYSLIHLLLVMAGRAQEQELRNSPKVSSKPFTSNSELPSYPLHTIPVDSFPERPYVFGRSVVEKNSLRTFLASFLRGHIYLRSFEYKVMIYHH